MSGVCFGRSIWLLAGYTFLHLHCYVNPCNRCASNCIRFHHQANGDGSTMHNVQASIILIPRTSVGRIHLQHPDHLIHRSFPFPVLLWVPTSTAPCPGEGGFLPVCPGLHVALSSDLGPQPKLPFILPFDIPKQPTAPAPRSPPTADFQSRTYPYG